TGEAWLGPDLEGVLEELANTREAAVLVVPFGFISDHLEILYDVDLEARRFAKDRGMYLERTDSPNTDVEFIEAMASAVRSVAPPPSGWTSPAARSSHLKKPATLGLDGKKFRGPC